jgi:hypothetical protein
VRLAGALWSTLQEVLQATLPEPAQQGQFAELYVQHQGDWAGFWSAAERLFGAAATAQLQLHVLRARLDGGVRNKAARGELRRGLPVGLTSGSRSCTGCSQDLP